MRRNKARLVTKGYMQQQGVDIDEVFAPVTGMELVRMILPVAAQEDWRVQHMDVKSAFLNGELQEEREMMECLGMSDLGLLTNYLGIEVRQYGHGISLCQSFYALKLLQKNGLENCNPCCVPMEPKLKLIKASTSPPVDATAYHSIVDAPRYLVNTRPDMAFSVSYVSRFMAKPREDHLVAVKHILRYIAGTLEYGV
ncbi:uncharacterized mitochondrial protein AtMg00810-like [Oryza glaberrima]|uniref:uncharacterized mitochondrial protein AtMg00810-like n=1 Tax=Oryza glaberrima TaxID=4538 RepID=UPI00224C2A71|nr:uncharacterized mitochondrial protein AtMg00810-like [Oryza glaberrima]